MSLDTNQLIEFKDGCLEFLPAPTYLHQFVLRFLFRGLDRFVQDHNLGEVFFAPLRTRTIPRHIREPDIVFVTRDQIQQLRQPPQGAKLVMEIVSPGPENRARDRVEKLAECAAAGIPEYWIVDPQTQTIEVHALTAEPAYALHGRFVAGDQATSALLPEFTIDVSECFRAVDEQV